MNDRKWQVHAARFAVSIAVLCTAGAAWAQSTPAADPKEARARELFDEAVQLADGGKWNEACPRFQEAHDLFSTGGTALQLANCYEKIGEHAKAYDLYLAILRNKANETYPERVKIARERAAALRKRLKPEQETAPQGPTAPDKPPVTTPLAPEQTPPTDEPSSSPAVPTQPDAEPSRVPAIIAFGVGGAGLVVGTVFGVMALSQHASVLDKCINNVCPPDQEPEQKAAETKAWVSNVGFAVGAVGVAVGVVLLVVQGRKANAGTQAAHTLGPVRLTSPGTLSVRF